MTDIISIDPVDFAGAIGHLAANGLYAILEGRDLDNENWFGGDVAQSEHDVYILAEYVSRTEAGGERLWRFAAIEALTDDGNYGDIPLSRRLAFNLFASTSLQALRELKAVQAALAQILAVAEYKEPPALKIEDSIFEPHGSLGDQEAYQAQWLKDQQAADRRELAAKLMQEAEAAADTMSLGAPIETETEDQNRPTALSVGQQEGATNEKETADQGQEAGGEPTADAGAQGSVADMVDNLPEAVDGDGGTPQADASEMASSPQQQTGEAGGSSDEGLSDDEAATGATAADPRDRVSDSSMGDDQPQQGPEQSTDAAGPEADSGSDGTAAGASVAPPKTPVKPKKTRKGKSPN
ncbi:hypothetical protein [Agrobacterium pusense]|uniref:hypothetical protein n=1 Tax=Agrobacterium pusense TaxID=648995 RepID=UPI000EBD0D01|nr:hypothetical protein [Agrobacterium pusense]HCJ71011.1 hypothetical protein [Agrobacterium sp.]